jgi:phytoene/squalene synthetase
MLKANALRSLQTWTILRSLIMEILRGRSFLPERRRRTQCLELKDLTECSLQVQEL